MAKKKVSRNSNGASSEQQMQNQTAPVTYQKSAELSRQSSMEDHDSSEEKFHNLKSLNAILLKQTMEKRQQIESLFQAKDALEAELSRSGTEKTQLRDELRGSGDENFMLKLEMDLFMGIVESRVNEMGSGVDGLVKEKSDRECEIRDLKREAYDLMCKLETEREKLGRVCDERDSIKSGFDLQREESNRLKESVVRMEMKETSLREEVGKLNSENDRMVKEMRKREELIERINKERTSLETTLEEKIREKDELKREIKGLAKEKMELETLKRDQKGEIVKLEKKLENLSERVKRVTKEEKGLRDQVIGLEKNLDEVTEKAKARAEQINELVKEKSIKESELEGLLVENNSIKKQMEMALAQSSDKETLVDQLLREKNDLVERIFDQEAEFVEMSKLAEERKHVAKQFGKEFIDQTNTIEKLSCDVSQLKDALALVEAERDNARKALDEEKRNRVALEEKVRELEKMIETTGKELEKVKVERGRLIKEKKELENRSESLRKEKSILQKDIVELKRDMGVLKTELETKENRGLTMLKSVSSLVGGLENKKGEQKREKGMDSYSVELEAIKKAFKNKESMVEEMKKEVEKMKHSVEDAHKKKGFWTLVSSVTTLLAVASAAYAAAIK
ncbi:hypothetical protein EUTSA_v10003823mg [Eutrema salsugineum]|uniref:Uncharacterized protein n=1 Tax=Eutrema salsugineum TaxID=72664 RepID=V4KM01_EUTSA|nr:myosin-11 [Eutrema salsugineum]ESQ32264.1 hypothetical protein EUTSA_v10003823mg [Eutrema salsugineum]